MRGCWLSLPGTEPGRRVTCHRGRVAYDFALYIRCQSDKDVVSDDQSAAIERLVPHHPEIPIQFAFGRKPGARLPTDPTPLKFPVQCDLPWSHRQDSDLISPIIRRRLFANFSSCR